MQLQLTLVRIGAVLWLAASVVLGQRPKQCSLPEKCTAIRDCALFREHAQKEFRAWPANVRGDAKNLYCGEEKRNGKKVLKVCCHDESEANSPHGRHLLDLEKCGKSTRDRIANGEIAEVFEFPWMALLRGRRKKFHCGGSLIADRYVLTAAHCNSIQVKFVRLGETDLSQTIDCITLLNGKKECAEAPQVIPVEKFIKHPKHSSSHKKNDIGLVKLQRPAKLNHNVQPICLPLPEVLPPKLPRKMTVSGWGQIDMDSIASKQLRYAHLPLVESARCNETLIRLRSAWSVDQSQVCAGAGDDKADNCQGDSGGPLQFYGKQRYVVHGVVSYGMATCGIEAEPGVYTKVSHYLKWIIENLE